MARVGTAYFVSTELAAQYYRDYDGLDGYETVRNKLDDGEIHIGKPPIKSGERIVIIDNGTRYAIESM
jgi:hypothetical protein